MRRDGVADDRQRQQEARDLAVVNRCLRAYPAASRVAMATFDRLPRVEDEGTFLLQARTVAAGRGVVGGPTDPEVFPIPRHPAHPRVPRAVVRRIRPRLPAGAGARGAAVGR